MQYGYIHVYKGKGKGKTSAAVGLSLRAAGAGYRVGFASFLKNGTSSEIEILKTLEDVTLFPFFKDIAFTYQMNIEQKRQAKAFYSKLLDDIAASLPSYDLFVLDEVLDALHTDLITEEALLSILSVQPKTTEIVLTGRYAPESVLNIADYITDMQAIRHPYDVGTAARKGIEY